MPQTYNIPPNCQLFAGIEPDKIPAMLGCIGASLVKVAPETTVLKEGDPSGSVGVVLKGGVRLERTDYYGKRTITGLLGAGEMFGEPYTSPGTATSPLDVVSTQESELLFLDSKKLMVTCTNECAFHHKLIFNFLQAASTRNARLDQKLRLLSGKTTRVRLMRYLLAQARKHNSLSFTLPFDRQELADYLDVDRSGLSTEIGKLKKEGIITCNKNSFRLMDEHIFERKTFE